LTGNFISPVPSPSKSPESSGSTNWLYETSSFPSPELDPLDLEFPSSNSAKLGSSVFLPESTQNYKKKNLKKIQTNSIKLINPFISNLKLLHRVLSISPLLLLTSIPLAFHFISIFPVFLILP
jgi:hypothetical protein